LLLYSRKQLEYLEKLHPGDGPFFKAGPKRIAGGYAIACTLDILVHLEPTILEGYPKLAEFLKAMLALPEFEGAKDQPMYFTR
jgi:glutathione S-transferase